MKKISKICALVLALSLLMSVSAFAATTLSTGTNGEDITLSFSFANNKKGTEAVTDKAAGEAFYAFVNFDGNPTDELKTAISYMLLIGYDETAIQALTTDSYKGQLTDPQTFNPNYDNDSIICAGLAATKPMEDDEEEIPVSGSFFRIDAVAAKALTVAEIEKIFTFVADEDFKILDKNNGKLTVYGPDVEEEKVPTDEAIAENIEADMTSITSEDGTVEYTNVAIFEEAFNLSDLADATAFGFKIGEKKSNYYGIKGEGTLNAVLAIYGVAGDLTVDTYKTILK